MKASDLLQKCFATGKNDWKVTLMSQWHKIFPSDDRIVLKKIYKNRLTVGVWHPCVANDFNLMSDKFIEKVNDFLGGKKVGFIKFVYSENSIAHKTGKVPRIFGNKKTSNNCTCVSDNLSKCQVNALGKIKSDGLQDSLKSFLLRCRKLRFKHVQGCPLKD